MLPALALSLAATLTPADLRCQAQIDPLAVETTRPTLSWKLRSGAKDIRQAAYTILVASAPEILAKDRGDLWDSGKVTSAQTFGIAYAGKPLQSRSQAWWKVKVWDQNGEASAWSDPARFAVGLLEPADWHAEWIHGAPISKPVDALSEATWVGPAAETTPAGVYRYRRMIKSSRTQVAKLHLTADNTFVLRLGGKEIARTTDPEGWRTPQAVDLKLDSGDYLLEVEVTNATDGPTGLLSRLELDGTVSAWTCEGEPVRELGKNGIAPWGKVSQQQIVTAPASVFRRPFFINQPLKRATVYLTALGIADLELNGKRITDDLFTPGWTDYHVRTHYRAFDITDRVKSGANELMATLGQGWFTGYVAWGYKREHYGPQPMMKAQVELEFENGQRTVIGTDSSWQVGQGPVLDEHFLHGEKFDARVRPGGWQPAKVGQYQTKLEAFPGMPVREYKVLKPKTIREAGPGKYILDFGQNLSGFARLKVKEAAGTVLTLRHAERLDQNGELYTTNLRAAKAVDQYICRGGGEETWNPRFTFHGFQYVEVSGLSQKPEPDTVQAVAISSATPETGWIDTSDPMLNQLVSNAWWTQKMNFIDVPTDCPQRDERLGWTGDAQAYIRTAAYYSDVQAFFRKWLQTLDDSQRADGQYPKVAPVLKGLDDGGPAWSDAGVICPVTMFDFTGDREMLARHYPNMRQFVEYCRARHGEDFLPPTEFHCFGDWLSINANTPNDVIAQAYFALSTRLLRDAARHLGNAQDAADYETLFQQARAAFRKAYVSADGRVKGETQTGYVLALGFDLLDEAEAKLAAGHLVRDIESRGWHLSTGFVGTRDLMDVLVKIEREDVAFRLLHNTTFPSWGFPIQHGATSIWERWDGWTPEKGFQDPGMNSFAHYAYGAVVGWMFQEMGGIQPLEPGFGRIRIAPRVDPKLDWLRCRYDSVRGLIRSEWKKVDGKLELTVEVPPNTTAEVRVPGGEVRTVGSGVWQFTGALP